MSTPVFTDFIPQDPGAPFSVHDHAGTFWGEFATASTALNILRIVDSHGVLPVTIQNRFGTPVYRSELVEMEAVRHSLLPSLSVEV